MHVVALLNRDGGTLRTTDLEAYSAHLRAAFEGRDHTCQPVLCAGEDLERALKEAAGSDCDAIVIGGGDGTVSAAAAMAWKSSKPLGVIPAGTMNLFARSIGMPLDIWDAANALANGSIHPADIATANGRAFVHQFSVGMHPRLVVQRDQQSHASRFGKMMASVKAALGVIAQPPEFHARVVMDGAQCDIKQFSMIAISNNVYGEGHLPFADKLDGGVLGAYSAEVLTPSQSTKLAADLLAGTWRSNPDFTCTTAREVVLEFPRLKRAAKATMDGELLPLAARVEVKIHPGELNLLLPGNSEKGTP